MMKECLVFLDLGVVLQGINVCDGCKLVMKECLVFLYLGVVLQGINV